MTGLLTTRKRVARWRRQAGRCAVALMALGTLGTFGAPEATADGLTGYYYNGRGFGSSELTATRVDETVDFVWGDDLPPDGLPTTNLTVRWVGQVEPLYSETYTFGVTSDDGSRLWVDGKQVVENWFDQGPTERTGTISLQAGRRYDIMLDHYQGGGGGAVSLRWSSATQVREVIPGSNLFSDTDLLSRAQQVGVFAYDANAGETPGETARYVVYRLGNLDSALVVNLELGGTAEAEVDYFPPSLQIELGPQVSSQRFELEAIDDAEVEGDETVEVRVATGFGYTPVGGSDAITLTVGDNDRSGEPPRYAITGELAYSELVEGFLVVGAYADPNFQTEVGRRALAQAGPYAISDLEPGTYYVRAFDDVNSNFVLDDGERSVEWTGEGREPEAITLPPDGFDINLTLPSPKEPEEDGCGCRSVSGRSRSGGGWIVLGVGALGVLVARRRRRDVPTSCA